MFKPSKNLSKSENHELEILESLYRVAPMTPNNEKRYNELIKKANRKSIIQADA